MDDIVECRIQFTIRCIFDALAHIQNGARDADYAEAWLRDDTLPKVLLSDDTIERFITAARAGELASLNWGLKWQTQKWAQRMNGKH